MSEAEDDPGVVVDGVVTLLRLPAEPGDEA